jgi:hypothetical protein
MTKSKNIVPAGSAGIPSRATTQLVDARLARAQLAEEIVLWTQVRGEIIRQDEEVADRRHKRWMTKAGLVGKGALSIVGVVAGVALLATSHLVGGLFALGAGLYNLAPGFTRKFFSTKGVIGGDE